MQFSRVITFMVVAALAMPGAGYAQVLYGSLTGNVTDASGGAVPGASVEAVNIGTGIVKQSVADDRGSYQFTDLQTGTYRVTVSAPSFRTVVQENLTVNANTVVRLDTRLEISQVAETVTVSASAVSLQTDRAEVSAQLASMHVNNLPIGSGRNFQQLYKLIPGASPPADAHSDAGNPQRSLVTNFNGVSYSNNNTRLDGATVSYPWLPHIVAYVPPAEAVETVNIVTNSFDAEQGMAGGAAVNVTIKSGTNDFHGSLHEFHTNSALRARNFFFVGNRLPKNIFNQFGGTFGGPIMKNKLFFFADWERTLRRQNASAFRTVPTDALRQGDFSGTNAQIYDPGTGAANGFGRQLFPNQRIPASRLDPAALKMVQLVPVPTLPGTTNNYFASGTYEFNRDNFDVKVNYNPTARSSMFGRYSFSPSDIFDPPSLGAAGGDALAGGQPGKAPGRIQSAAVGGTYTVSPRILIDGNVGFTRQRLGAQNIDIDKNYGLDVLNIPGTNGPDPLQGGYPRFTITGYSSIGNPNVSNPFLFRDNQYVTAGNLGWTKGAHSLRFGGEYTYYTINHFQPQAAYGPRGGFNFTGGLTVSVGGTPAQPVGGSPTQFNGLADFLLGLPQAMGKDLQYVNPSAVRMPSWGFYARDQWQISRKLTLNYGMRYEYYPFATRDHRGGERYDPVTNKVLIGGFGDVPEDTGVDVGKGQIAPRFGFAYRATEKTVVRAGYGISIDPNSFRNMRDAYPVTISSQFSGASSLQAFGSLRTGIPETTGPALGQGMIDLPVAVGTQTFPQVFKRGYIQSFNFTVERDIGANFYVQGAFVGSRAIRQTANVNINAAQGPGGGNSGRALFPQYGRIANINMLMPFNTASYNSLQTNVTRRLNANLLGMSYTFSKSISYADNSDSGLSWHWVEMWDRNRALSNFDRTHNLQIYGIFELPFGAGKRWATQGLTGLLAGGWQINGIFSSISGTPFTVTAAATSLNSPGNAQTADQVKPKVEKLGQIGNGTSWFDPYAFLPVTGARFGNSGRNTLRGPGLVNLDASVFRNFKLTERFNLQFRTEAFNVSNTPAFNNPGANASAPVRAQDGTITNLGGFTSITSAQATERQIRFALKLSF